MNLSNEESKKLNKEDDMKDELTDLSHWESEWGDIESAEWDNGFLEFIPDMHTVLNNDKYRSILDNGTAIEIGCFPGRYMRYFSREFNMKVKGLDFMSYKEPSSKSDALDVTVADFNEFTTNDKFDLVCSFGFIEHFNDLKGVIEKHIDLAKSGGLIVISVPNYSVGWRSFIKRVVDRQLFVTHNKDAMKVEHLNSVLSLIPTKSASVQHILFSQKLFNATSMFRKVLGSLVRVCIKFVPWVDKGLSGEILIVIEKK